MEGTAQVNSDKMYWVNHKPNAFIPIIPTPDKDFFTWWCILLTAFVKLTPKEIEVVASFLRRRHELSKSISSSDILDSQLMSNDVRNKIIEECGITLANFYVIKGNLKKNGIITENGINPKLIPRFRDGDEKSFQLLISFKDIVGI